MSKDAFWFKHDANARRNPKLVALRGKYGYAGVGMWWAIVEILRESTDYRLRLEKEWQIGALAKELDCRDEGIDVMDFISDLVDNYELLQRENGAVFSQTLIDRMQPWDERKRKLSEAGKKGAEKRWGGDSETNGENREANGGANGGANALEEESRRDKKREEVEESASGDENAANTYPKPENLRKLDSGSYAYPDLFEQFWSAYPRNTSKKKAYKRWRSWVATKGTDPDDLIVAAENYACECKQQGRETKFIKHGSTFLSPSEGEWEQYVDGLPDARGDPHEGPEPHVDLFDPDWREANKW